MADVQSTRITGAFGSEKVPVPNSPSVDAGIVVAPNVQLDTPVHMTDESLADSPRFANAAAMRSEAMNTPDASIFESAGAATKTWVTSRIWDTWNRPHFDNEKPINVTEALDHVPMVLSEDERDYMLRTSHGAESFAYSLQYLQDQRQAADVAGQHPVVALGTQFVDPVWFVVPPMFKLGKLAGLSRTANSLAQAGLTGAAVAAQEGAVSDQEIAMSMVVAGAVTHMFVDRAGNKLVDKTRPAAIDQKAIEVQDGVKINVDRLNGTPNPATGLEAGALNTDRAALADTVEKNLSSRFGEFIQVNMRKEMSTYSKEGDEVANLMYDNNSDLSKNSVESHRESILGALTPHLVQYEGKLLQAMAEDGYGTLNSLKNANTAYEVQLNIEKQVQLELFRMEQSARTGTEISNELVPKRIQEMAQIIDNGAKQALKELKNAGVKGAEGLEERAGYLNRKWSSKAMDDMRKRMESLGLTTEQANRKMHALLAGALRRANGGMTQDVAQDISQAIVTRALNKGYFEDTVFNSVSSEGTVNEIRSLLKNSNISQERIDKVLAALRVDVDEKGKAGILKHRMDLDYKAVTQVGGETFNVHDLIDNRVTTLVEQYNRRVATSAAFARKGLSSATDIDALRSRLLHSIEDTGKRDKARQLFDTTMAHFRGEPVGEAMNEYLRMTSALSRAITLAWSGVYQMFDYATAFGIYGVTNALAHAVREAPILKHFLSAQTDASKLNFILSENSMQSMRMRPFISRYEDGHELSANSGAMLWLQRAADAANYANGLKYVHGHQAKMVGNLIMDRVGSAAKGDKAARQMLEQYGLEAPVMDKLAREIEAHGMTVDKWDDKVWAEARPAFDKMMDESVLKTRLGDMPAFAMFDQVGKFIFTYMSFIFTAHNKLLAGLPARGKSPALAMLLLYQLPLAVLGTKAKNDLKGTPAKDDSELIAQTVGQMSGLGLLTEPFNIITGQARSGTGSAMLSPITKGQNLLKHSVNGDFDKAGTVALTMLPVVSASPIINGWASQRREEEK